MVGTYAFVVFLGLALGLTIVMQVLDELVPAALTRPLGIAAGFAWALDHWVCSAFGQTLRASWMDPVATGLVLVGGGESGRIGGARARPPRRRRSRRPPGYAPPELDRHGRSALMGWPSVRRGRAPSYGQGVDIDLDEITRRRQQIGRDHLHRDRPPSSARGLHHTALVSGDVERTVRFYQDVLGFPLTEVMENRDYAGSTHFFFDIGNGNALAFFDFPGLDVGPYAEVLGGLHHIAISIERPQWEAAWARLTDAGVEVTEEGGVSLYFRDPDGARLELLAEPLGQMYGERVV